MREGLVEHVVYRLKLEVLVIILVVIKKIVVIYFFALLFLIVAVLLVVGVPAVNSIMATANIFRFFMFDVFCNSIMKGFS